MTLQDIINIRLRNQHLIKQKLKSPEEVVSLFGAIQSQDYPAARWATAYRTKKPNAELVDQAYNEGTILRTHVMRPTWHFVAAEDIRWMVDLTAPRLTRISSYYGRQLGLDQVTFQKANKLFEKVLRGGKALTRDELKAELIKAKIFTKNGTAAGFLTFQAEIENIICSGPMKGRKMTYALTAERAPQAKKLSRDEAIAELTKRYFQSHAPAQLRDYVWWSGLTTSDARRGIDMLGLKHIEIDDKKYWYAGSLVSNNPEPFAYLLPNYDEYTVAYKDRTALFPHHSKDFYRKTELFLGNTLIINGIGVGGWRRAISDKGIAISILLFKDLKRNEMALLEQAVRDYGDFYHKPATYTFL